MSFELLGDESVLDDVDRQEKCCSGSMTKRSFEQCWRE